MTTTVTTLQDEVCRQLALLRESSFPSGQVLLFNPADSTFEIGSPLYHKARRLVVLMGQWRLVLEGCPSLTELAEYIVGKLNNEDLDYFWEIAPPKCIR